MKFIEMMERRRSNYDINDKIEVSEEEIVTTIQDVIRLTPDAFNMQSTKVVLSLGADHKDLWDEIEKAFGGQVSPEKIESFRKGYGTVLYYIDTNIVDGLKEQFPLYAANFDTWANHASGMAQYNVWLALRELGLGATVQHYNPVIDDALKQKYNLGDNFKLVSQMPFGAIGEEAELKEKVDINERVFVKR